MTSRDASPRKGEGFLPGPTQTPVSETSVRSAPLQRLLERVEKAEREDRPLDHELFLDLEWAGQGDHRKPPTYTASLDAALALVERCLPDHQWLVRQHHEGAPFGRGYFANVPTGWPGERRHFDAYGKTAALALLAAMLKALIAQEQQP